MRVAFLGTPPVAAATLRKIVNAGHNVPIVVTRPDKRRSRNAAAEPSPVKAAALELGLDVTHDLSSVADLKADVAVVAAFGRLIPKELLERTTFVNIHPSLLPRWRGAAPVQHTILSGDIETGVCVMRLVAEMDAGPLYGCLRATVGDSETADELLPRLFALGSDLLVRYLNEGLPEPSEQTGTPTYAAKLTPDDARIDWSATALTVDRTVRAGRAWTTFRGRRLIIETAVPIEGIAAGPPGTLTGDVVATGEGALRLLLVRPEGKPARSGAEWVNGARLEGSERLV